MRCFEQQGILMSTVKVSTGNTRIFCSLDDLRAFMQDRYTNDGLSEVELQKITNRLQLIPASPLYSGNRETFWLINEGFDLVRDDVSKVALHIDYIDFDNPQNNILRL